MVEKVMLFLDTVTLKDVIYFLVAFVGIVSIVVEKAKKLPFHPWTHFFEWFGKCLNKSVLDRLEKVEQTTKANNEAITELDKKMEKKFEESQKEADEKEAKRLRASIISFADTCRVGQHHTQNHFENIFRDYSDYVAYCDKHDIPNHYIDEEFKYIQGIYQECLKENKFL